MTKNEVFEALINSLIKEQNEAIARVNERLPNNQQPLITSRYDSRMTAIYLGAFSVFIDPERAKLAL